MRKYVVSVWWEKEIEAEDEGDALNKASESFDFIFDADAEEIEEDEE
jgi:hypothetical protein